MSVGLAGDSRIVNVCACRTAPNGMLTIFSPQGGDDSGVYRCQVTDGVTSQSRDYVVTVQRQYTAYFY